MKEAVVPSSTAGSPNVDPPVSDIERVDAFPKQRESILERWGLAALDERRERTRERSRGNIA